MHPSFEVEREYVCRVRAPEGQDVVSDNIVERLTRGVALEDGPAKFDEIERVGGSDSHDWFRVVVKEGRNREVRRLWESQGCQVSRLKRVRYGKVALPRELLRGQSQELAADKVEAMRNELGLESDTPSALTLQPVIGQRKASKSTIDLTGRARSQGYVGGHNTADEGRELRRFDHVREDRGGRGRGGPRKHGGLTVSGEMAAKQSQKPFKQRKEKGPKPLPEGNPAAFRSWYVPEGVDTGPTGHRNPENRGPGRANKSGPYGNKGGRPGGGGYGERGPRPEGGFGERGPRREGGFGERGPRREGGFGGQGQGEGRGGGYGERGPRQGGFGGERGPRGPGGGGGGQGQGRAPKPYGHPGNAPHFPSDHAGTGGFNPYGDKPRGPRPAGRPGGPRPAGGRPGAPGGNRPGGNRGPGGPRPSGPRPGGPRGGGRPGGGRHSGG
jgi:23S rRNA pseudouridine2605 synthase